MLALAWLLVPFPVATLAIPSNLLGVPPDLLPLYKSAAQSSTWKCLDGSKSIPFSAVNDDFCDCLDGSDEPGTSACPDNRFYCTNEGHIGAYIKSSRVNDGLCEKECCDGSDEPSGVCPNNCDKIGKEHREKVAAALKIQKTGSKIRSSYISFAQKEKKRLKDLVITLGKEVDARKAEEKRMKAVVDQSESMSKAALEHKKQSPLYLSLHTHSEALAGLLRQHKKLQEREKQLGDILETLRDGYNPNYQDMAVLEAVRGWDALSGAEDETKDPDVPEINPPKEWEEDELETLISTDKMTLLLEHDTHLSGNTAQSSSILHLASYIPDDLAPMYETARSTLVSWMSALGIISSQDGQQSDESNRARKAHSTAVTALQSAESAQETAESDLKKLFSPDWFGAEGEWKKLDGTCLEHDVGEYIYSICLFGAATQRSTKGGGQQNLGQFTSWNPSPDVKEGSLEYYSRQVYKHGTRCWNGPERSITIDWSCGIENALLEVSEPEKCEYRVTGTTPALCLPPGTEAPAAPNSSASAPESPKEEL